jgi:hypothetical protein
MNEKYGMLMLGREEGRAYLVAPYTEGRHHADEKAFTVAKGDAQSADRTANAEFREETGIDAGLLALPPGHPVRKGAYGRAEILARLSDLPPFTFADDRDRPAALHLDIIIVRHISDLAPFLKGAQEADAPVERLAAGQGLPPFARLISRLHDEGFPLRVETEAQFRTYMEEPRHRERWQEALSRLRQELEDAGFISDEEGLKFDDKVNPLHYFREGAELLTLEDYTQRVTEAAQATQDRPEEKYRVSMLGTRRYGGMLDAVLMVAQDAKALLDACEDEPVVLEPA